MSQDISSTEKTKLCHVCKEVQSKYRCPGCLSETCSLPCVKAHKLNTACSGVRDKTAFVRIKDFTDLHLLSDYRMLEDTARKTDSVARDKILKRKTFKPRFLKRLTNQAKQRGITLQILPQGFTRRKMNSTFYQEKTQSIVWHVEWVFPQAEAKFRDKRVPESETLLSSLEKFLDPQKADPVIRHRLKRYTCQMDTLKCFMKVEGRKANSVRYHELCISETLAENLSGKTITEYPVIDVVLRDYTKDYNVLGKEADSSDSSADSSSSDGTSSSEEDMDSQSVIQVDSRNANAVGKLCYSNVDQSNCQDGDTTGSLQSSTQSNDTTGSLQSHTQSNDTTGSLQGSTQSNDTTGSL